MTAMNATVMLEGMVHGLYGCDLVENAAWSALGVLTAVDRRKVT